LKKSQKTAQRAAIMAYLKDNAAHPTVLDIYRAVSESISNISIATVYNTMNMLKKKGYVRELPSVLGEGKRYDPNTVHHDHLICTACGAIVDVSLHHPPSLSEEDRQGFDIHGLSINVFGLCPRCKNHCGAKPPLKSFNLQN
jgi:Fur family transcriptional regulator, peroxide stress response regulator